MHDCLGKKRCVGEDSREKHQARSSQDVLKYDPPLECR